VDAAEDAEHGPERWGDELPAELQQREQRLSKIRDARLEAHHAEEDRQKARSENDDGKRPRAAGVFPFSP
jgi:hypothetical protein